MKKSQKTKPDRSDAAAQRWMRAHCRMPSLPEPPGGVRKLSAAEWKEERL